MGGNRETGVDSVAAIPVPSAADVARTVEIAGTVATGACAAVAAATPAQTRQAHVDPKSLQVFDRSV